MASFEENQELLKQMREYGLYDSEEEKALEEADMARQINETSLNPVIDAKEFKRDVDQSEAIQKEFADELNNETTQALEQLEKETPYVDPIKQYSPLLNDFDLYKRLNDAQQSRKDTLTSAGILAGANKISQGIARGYGAEVGAGDEYAKQMIERADLPIKEIKELKDATDVDLSLQMADPKSDISGFAREQATSQMLKLNPNFDKNMFQNMSAAQLEKLGFKNSASSLSDLKEKMYASEQTGLLTRQGAPVRFDRLKQQYIDAISGEPVQASDLVRSNVVKDSFGNVIYAGTPGQGNVIIADTKRPNVTEEKIESQKNFVPDKEQRKALDDEKKRVDGLAKEIAGRVASASRLKDGLKAGTKLTKAFVQTQMPRLAGEVGNLNQTEQEIWQGSSAIADVIAQKLQTWTDSTLTEGNVKELNELINVFEKNANQSLNKIYDTSYDGLRVVHQIPKAFSAKAYKGYNVKPIQEMVKIQLPNGKTGTIPKDKLEEAKKRGAKEI